jgi:hypothetical protein
MVSDPDQQANGQNYGPDAAEPAAPSVLAGFSATAAPAPSDESVAESSGSKAWARRFQDSCDQLWTQMKDRFQKRNTYTATTDPEVADVYKKFWFRSALGHQVYDCGDCLRMAATKEKPLTQKQIEQMVMSAITRKDPPWETMYIWDPQGKPDLKRAAMVQSVINDMRTAGKIPADNPIHVSMTYPCAHMKDFNKFLRSMFADAASNPNAAAPQARAGIHAHERGGFHAA